MAKRKRKHKVSGARRRRHSGMGAIDTTNILGVVGGAVLAGYLNKIVPATVNDKVLAGGKVALGVALPMIFKSGKTKNIMTGVGAGMIAVGSVDLLKSFGALSGSFDIPVVNGDILAGDEDEMGQDIPVVNGDVLGGDDDMNMGFDDLSGDED
jgi:hypothetical protein